MRTVRDLCVTCPRPNPYARVRLFCLPYSGGGTSVYRAWPDGLPRSIEVRPIRCPGRENRVREAPHIRLPPLVAALGQALEPYLDIPYAFFGHSLGALVSFELCRRFRRQALPGPVHLFVSACGAPQVPSPNPPMHQLPDAEFTVALRRLSGTPEAVFRNPELMELLLPVLRADFAVAETYVYGAEEPLECPISAFGGLEDDAVSRGSILAWRDQTLGDYRMRMLPGDHFFLHRQQAEITRHIAEDLRPFTAE